MVMKEIIVKLEPEQKEIVFERLKSVHQLLNKLEMKSTQVLIIRGQELLTMDCKLFPGDKIIVRKITSRG